MVTVVPPATAPPVGVIAVTAGARYVKAPGCEAVPASVVTATSTAVTPVPASGG